MRFLAVQQKINGLPHMLILNLTIQVLVDHLGALFRRDVGKQIGAEIAGHRHIIARPGIAGGIDQAGIQSVQDMRLYIAGVHGGVIHVMTVEKIDQRAYHLHMAEFFRANIQKQILYFGVFDAETLGNILHGGF